MSEVKILHIETSGKNCSVAISNNEDLLCLCEEMSEDFSHSKKLHTFIQWALEGAEININDLDAISVSKGPGSYTGLRIGVSAAKGLAFGLNKPLLSTDSLRTLAFPYFNEGFDYIVSTIDARRNEIFYQVFEKNQSDSSPKNIEISVDFVSQFKNKKTLFLGSGSTKIEALVLENPQIQFKDFIFDDASKISAQDAILEAYQKFQKQDFEDVAYFEPDYVKSVHITTPKSN